MTNPHHTPKQPTTKFDHYLLSLQPARPLLTTFPQDGTQPTPPNTTPDMIYTLKEARFWLNHLPAITEPFPHGLHMTEPNSPHWDKNRHRIQNGLLSWTAVGLLQP